MPAVPGGRWLAALLAALVVAGYAWLADSSVLPDLGGDNAAYWLTAQGWSPWQAPSVVQASFAHASTYPPLYPLLLAWLGGGASLAAAHAVTGGMLLAAFMALAWFARTAGLDRIASTGVVLALAATSIARQEGMDLHSEPLYLLWLMLALGLGVKLRAGGRVRDALLLGACVAAALLTRAAGVTLLAALGLMALRTRRREWSIALVPGGVALAANALLQHSQQRYAGEFLSHYAPGELLAVLGTNLHVIPGSWAVAIAGPGAGLASLWGLGLFGLAALVAAGWRALDGQLDGLHVLAYLALVAVWPYPAEMPRLLLPLVALAPLEVCLAARAIWDCRATFAWRQLWWLPLGFALADTAGFLARSLAPVPAGLEAYRKTSLWQQPETLTALAGIGFQQAADAAFAVVREVVPAGGCVLSIKPSVVTAFSGRASAVPPPAHLDAAAFEAALAASGCHHALLMAFASPSYPEPFYPARRLEGRLRALAEFPNAANAGQQALILAEILPPR